MEHISDTESVKLHDALSAVLKGQKQQVITSACKVRDITETAVTLAIISPRNCKCHIIRGH